MTGSKLTVALAAAFFALGAAVAKGASADGIAEGERFKDASYVTIASSVAIL